MLFQRLTQLQQPTNLRRFDVTGELDISESASPVARTADTFVALRPNGRANEPKELIENLLFGTGRHLFLVPDAWNGFTPLDNIIVAWTGSRRARLPKPYPICTRRKRSAFSAWKVSIKPGRTR
jgi:hypothetical protein